MDYKFRKLDVNYLSFDDRLELGLASTDDMPDEQTIVAEPTLVVEEITTRPAKIEPKTIADSTAPLCFNCGNQTQKSGSCYVCTSCGSTTGCS